MKTQNQTESNMIAWTVTLHHMYVDTVFFSPSMDSEYVRNSLINHDGFDPEIYVHKE
jgi:hypothetical protein